MSEIVHIFSLAAFPIFGIAVFIFIIAQSAFNAARSGLKPTTIGFKALAALAIWFAVSFVMLCFIFETATEPEEFRGGLETSVFRQPT